MALLNSQLLYPSPHQEPFSARLPCALLCLTVPSCDHPALSLTYCLLSTASHGAVPGTGRAVQRSVKGEVIRTTVLQDRLLMANSMETLPSQWYHLLASLPKQWADQSCVGKHRTEQNPNTNTYTEQVFGIDWSIGCSDPRFALVSVA